MLGTVSTCIGTGRKPRREEAPRPEGEDADQPAFDEAIQRTAAEPGTPDQGLTVKQEIKAIHEAMVGEERHGGFVEAGRRSVELQRLPEAKATEGVSISSTLMLPPNPFGPFSHAP